MADLSQWSSGQELREEIYRIVDTKASILHNPAGHLSIVKEGFLQLLTDERLNKRASPSDVLCKWNQPSSQVKEFLNTSDILSITIVC